MDEPLRIWWLCLCAAALFNVLAWMWSARRFGRHASSLSPEMRASRRLLLWLAAGYVLGCAFRSVFPMVDVPRICLHDNPFSRIAVGRTVATIAELCLAMQWSVLLREAGTGDAVTARVGRLIFPLIVLAESFSWGAVITSNFLLHAIENSLWTLCAAMAIAAFISLRTRANPRAARFLEAAGVIAGGYVAFMVTVDVPMYLSRWYAELGTAGVPLAHSVQTLLDRCIVEPRWTAWREDVPWLSLYFTLAVWISIALPHAPRLGKARG
jgi:hypothetical protein